MMLSHDFKYAIRLLRKTPVNTTIAIVSLGLAIGAAAAGLSIVNALFAKDIAIPSPRELVAIGKIEVDRPDDRNPLLLSQFEEIRRRNRVFSHVFAWRDVLLRNLEVNGAKYFGTVNEVSGDYFSALRVQPYLGRVFSPDEVATIGTGSLARVAVLEYRCWEQRFGRDVNVLGKLLVVDGVPLTIIGVMPSGFVGLNIVSTADAIVPLGFDIGRIPDGPVSPTSSPNYYVAARLQPGTAVEAANAFLQSSWPAIVEATLPPSSRGAERTRFLASKIGVESLRTGSAGGTRGLRYQLKGPLTKLLWLSASVLLVAFLNLAGLVLSRAAGRRYELGLRASLGAGRYALVRVTVVEAVLMSAVGAVLGALAAFWTAPLLFRSFLKSQPLRPLAIDVSPDARILAISVASAIAIGVLCALLPIWHVTGRNPVSILRQNTRAVRGGVTVFQKCVICVQVSLAFVLTTGAFLFGRSLHNLHALQPGFRTEGVVTMDLLPQLKHQTIPNRTAYYKSLSDALASVPGVDSVSYALLPPLTPVLPTPVSAAHASSGTDAIVDFVGPGFFRTLGMTLLAGRDFDWHDDQTAPRIAVISDSLAAQLFPGRDPIGQTLDLPAFAFASGARIIGVVNSASLWRIQSHRPRAVYLALMQAPAIMAVAIELHAIGDVAGVTGTASHVIESMKYHYAFRTDSLTEAMKYALVDERVLSGLSAFFAGVTTLLGGIGLYGLLSYAVTRRTAEIGIRAALGARRIDIVRMILREAAWLLLWSLALGVPSGMIGLRLAADILFGVTPYDPLTMTLSAIILGIIMLTAAYVPAQRASRIDPLAALGIE